MGADGGLEDGEGTRFEFVFFELSDLEFSAWLGLAGCAGWWLQRVDIRELVARLAEEFSGSGISR